jgi:hypothetical protein
MHTDTLSGRENGREQTLHQRAAGTHTHAHTVHTLDFGDFHSIRLTLDGRTQGVQRAVERRAGVCAAPAAAPRVRHLHGCHAP